MELTFYFLEIPNKTFISCYIPENASVREKHGGWRSDVLNSKNGLTKILSRMD